jgi:hypothetical protein
MMQYVYGIVPADSLMPPGLSGVNKDPVHRLVRGAHAALVTPVEDPDALASTENLLAHGQVLDQVAATVSVLPMTFGTVVPDADTVTEDVLPSMQEAYASLLRRIEGAVQFTVRVRYEQETVLAEIVSENPEIARLQQVTANQDESAFHYERIRLGELVVAGLERKAAADSGLIEAALAPLARETGHRESNQPGDVIDLAALVDRHAADAFVQAVEDSARRSSKRLRYRLLGPQAPYDFVGEL